MAATVDDKRAASSITAALSSYLMTAALGVIAAEAVIVTFAFDKREHLFWFDLFSGAGLVASTGSIYFGGRGIGELARRGFDGDWITKTSRGHFSKQAFLALAGILLVSASVFCGRPKVEKPSLLQEYLSLRDATHELQQSVANLQSRNQTLTMQLDALAASVQKLSLKPPRPKK